MKKTLLLALAALILQTSSYAQNKDEAQDLLASVRRTYVEMKAYHFEITILIERKATSGLRSEYVQESTEIDAESTSGKKHVETFSGDVTVQMIDDGTDKWVWLSSAAQYSRKGLDGVPEVLKPVVSYRRDMHTLVAANLGNPKILREETLDLGGEKVLCHVVQAESAGVNSSSPPIVTMWIDKNSHLIRKQSTRAESKMSDRSFLQNYTYTFTVAKTGEPSAELFKFKPPSGSKEVDVITFEGVEPPRPGASSAGGALVGKLATDFTLKDLDGQTVSLKDLRGKIVLLNFWASWCGPCRMELPHIEKLRNDMKDVVFLGINDEKPDVARKFISSNRYTFRTLADERNEVGRQYGVSAIPQVFIIGRDGTIVAHFLGARSESELRSALSKAEKSSKPSDSSNTAKNQPAPNRENHSAPTPISPKSGDILPNRSSSSVTSGEDLSWLFQWSEYPRATEYQLYVIGGNASDPIIDRIVNTNSYRHIFGKTFITDSDLRGWRWKVRAKVNGVWTAWSDNTPFEVDGPGVRRTPVSTRLPQLGAPKPILPADGSVFEHYPRKTVLQWEAVPGADYYKIEIDYFDSAWHGSAPSFDVRDTQYVFDFVGAQPGRWRVWAIGRDGQDGIKSNWQGFRYLK